MSLPAKQQPLRYVSAAFNVRTKVKGLGGVPVNWVALAGVAVLGLINPGFWVLGAAAEIGFLTFLSQNKRFRKVVDGRHVLALKADGEEKTEALLDALSDTQRQRYDRLVERTNSVAGDQHSSKPMGTVVQGGLERLQSIYLNLLRTQQELERYQALGSDVEVAEKLAEQRRVVDALGTDSAPGLLKSATETLRILERRDANRRSARERLAFTESELTRIEQQSDLIVEDAALSSDPTSLSQHIDAVTATYDDTLEMMRSYRLEEEAL